MSADAAMKQQISMARVQQELQLLFTKGMKAIEGANGDNEQLIAGCEMLHDAVRVAGALGEQTALSVANSIFGQLKKDSHNDAALLFQQALQGVPLRKRESSQPKVTEVE